MGQGWLALLLIWLVFVAVTGTVFRLPKLRLPRRPRPQPAPAPRPLEDIVRDARRLNARFVNPPRGTSFAKQEAVRHTYDRVLSEACAALEVEHLLQVLPPGEELDVERARVEGLLWLAGLRIDEAA